MLWTVNLLLGGTGMTQPLESTPVVHIIDDDDSVRLMLDSLLRSVSFNVRTYGSTQEFLKADSLGVPGCIVLDIRLPGINGLDFQEQLQGLGINLPVVLMSGEIERGTNERNVSTLAKPFQLHELLNVVAKSLNGH